MRHKLLRAAAVAGAAALLLTSCADSGTSDSANEPREELVWAMKGANLENGHMDPHRSQIDSSAMLARMTLDSLTYLGADGEIKPWLASDWKISDDNTSVEFTLRDDVTFSDGEAFNAAAVKANFDHVMAEETESTHANQLLGGELYKDTVVVDDHTVRVEFSQPFAPFLTNVSSAFLGIYSPATLAENAQQLPTGGPGVSVGSGPWIMTDLKAGSTITYERNADYAWAPDGMEVSEDLPQTLTVNLVPDDQLRAESVISGEAVIATELSPVTVDGLGDVTIENNASPGVPFSLYLNEKHGALADKSVRQALQFGIDREAAVNAVYLGYYDAGTAMLSPTTPNITPGIVDDKVGYDAEKAAKLLDDAGWVLPDGEEVREKDGQKLELTWISWTPRSDDRQALADLLIDQWRQLGVAVTNEVVEPGTYNEKYGAGDFDLTDWSFASLDADMLRNHLSTEGFQNASHVSDEKIDALLDRGVASFDPAERTAVYDELLEWNADYVAILPVFNPSVLIAVSPSLNDLVLDANGWPLLHAAH